MLDSHVHIGQFQEMYYHFDRIFEIILGTGKIDEIVYSSTSSCINAIKYNIVRKEIEGALKKYPTDIATPLFWGIPDYINQGIKI